MNLLRQSIYYFLVLLIIPILAFSISNPLSESQIVIDADKFEYFGDQYTGKVVAIGNVEAIQDNQKVTANLMEYNFHNEILLAEDKVKILEKTGYIIEADRVILSDRLRLGSVNDFTVLLPDKSTLKGKFAKKEDHALTHITKGYYTACQICPGKAPIWVINASSTEIDQEQDSIQYRNAIFNVHGVPVLYTPYFFHYTSKAKRRSGFLKPEYGGSTYLGTAVKIPYYFNISPNQDATVKLMATGKRGQVLEGEHRYLMQQGQITSMASVTPAKDYAPPLGQTKPKHNMRYNMSSSSDLALSNKKNFGWNLNNTSDKTYRRDYGYGSKDFLTSRIYNNATQDNGFYEVQSLAFQNLRPDNSNNTNPINQTPMVMPLFESKHKFFEFADSSSLDFETNFLKIHRYNGPDSNRISLKNRWNKDLILDSGHDLKFFGSVRSDIYHYDDAPIQQKLYTGTTSRTIPEAGVNWSYPLTRSIGDSKIVVSPLANAVITPHSKYNDKIYSEDSSNISEVNEGNLFAESQYAGIDIIENTPRIGYGAKSIVYYQDYLNASALFGQMYRQYPQEYLAGTSKERFSDYVGRLQLDLKDSVTLSYRYKLDKDSLINKANEAEIKLQHNKIYFLTNILYYRDDQVVNQVKNRREVYFETGISEYNDISASLNARRNLSSKKDNPTMDIGFISTGGKIQYFNDCVLYSASVDRDFTKNKDKKTNTTYWFNISFKNLG